LHYIAFRDSAERGEERPFVSLIELAHPIWMIAICPGLLFFKLFYSVLRNCGLEL
jgi:hypothetical protein